MGHVYIATNIKNGKQYVGITTRPLEERIRAHYYGAKYPKTYFHNAINKYGTKSFRWNVLETITELKHNTLLNILHEKETKYIKQYHTFRHGYNLTEGGEGTTGLIVSKDAVQRRILRLRGIQSGTAKLTESDVLDIKKMLVNESITIQAIADAYNVNKDTIRYINTRRTWGHITLENDDNYYPAYRPVKQVKEVNGRKINNIQVHAIKLLLRHSPYTMQRIAETFGISKKLVSLINNGVLWNGEELTEGSFSNYRYNEQKEA